MAGIDERGGTLRNGPEGWSGGGTARIPGKRPPVQFDTQGGPQPNVPWESTLPLSTPEVQRRTLPGQTIITGTADADVVSVTLVTPRDVRTLRPSGPKHAFIVVYDGVFFRGALTATVELRDGHTVTEQVPNGPGGLPGPAPPTPSLATRLRGDEVTLRGMRDQLARAEHASGGRRAKLLGGGSLAMLVQGLRQIRAIVASDKARLAYERAHPGVLPAP
jgi:hypothetical protein